MKARTQDDYIRTALRVPPELHARIHEAAKDSGRTFNAEIVARLEASFSTAESTLPLGLREYLEEVKRTQQQMLAYMKQQAGEHGDTLLAQGVGLLHDAGKPKAKRAKPSKP